MLMRVVIGVVVVALLVGGGAVLLAGSPIRAGSEVIAGATIECAGTTRITTEEDCRGWGDGILGGVGPSTTFEVDDVARLTLNRPLLGLAGSCEATWYLERYPDDPVWREEVPCAAE